MKISMKKFTVLEIVLALFLLGVFAEILITNVMITAAEIPTVINGLVTSISMIIGFSGALMVFTFSKRWDTLKLGSSRPMLYLLLVGLPLVLLWALYYNFILLGNPVYAIKLGLLDLAIASAVLVDFLAYYSRETILQMRENTRRERQSIQTQEKHEKKETDNTV